MEDSSSNFDDPTFEITQHIGRNHVQMCRFENIEDPDYEKVSAAFDRLKRIVEVQNVSSG